MRTIPLMGRTTDEARLRNAGVKPLFKKKKKTLLFSTFSTGAGGLQNLSSPIKVEDNRWAVTGMLIASLYAHQPAAGPKRQKERKTERKQRRGSITFEYFERYKFPVFSFQDVFLRTYFTNSTSST